MCRVWDRLNRAAIITLCTPRCVRAKATCFKLFITVEGYVPSLSRSFPPSWRNTTFGETLSTALNIALSICLIWPPLAEQKLVSQSSEKRFNLNILLHHWLSSFSNILTYEWPMISTDILNVEAIENYDNTSRITTAKMKWASDSPTNHRKTDPLIWP